MYEYLSQEWLDHIVELGRNLPEIPGVSARIQYRLQNPPSDEFQAIQYFTVIVDGRVIEARFGEDPEADVTLSQTYQDALAIQFGMDDANKAFMEGRIKVTGNMRKLMDLLPLTNSDAWREVTVTSRDSTIQPDSATTATTTAGVDLALTLTANGVALVNLAADGTYRFADEMSQLHRILYVESLSAMAHAHAIEEFEYLLNGKTDERQLQDFLEGNPYFLTGSDYIAAHPHVVLENEDSRLIPDFVLEPANPSRLCDLLELKLPSEKILASPDGRPRLTAALLKAAAQLRDYSDFFELPEQRQKIEDRYGLRTFRPRLFVVIGRREGNDPIALRRAEGELPNLTLRTYDDLIEQVKARFRSTMRSGNRRTTT